MASHACRFRLRYGAVCWAPSVPRILEACMIALSNATLLHLPASVAVPRYDRGALRIGIVHIGVGNFHRTHQALYVDACLHDPNCVSWGICGVGLSDGPAARAKAATYAAQDGLYTVSEFSPEGEASTRVVGAMVAYLYAPSDPEAVLARLAHPDTRVVTLTITEGGYNLDEGDGRVYARHARRRPRSRGRTPRARRSAFLSRDWRGGAPLGCRRLPSRPATTFGTTATRPAGPWKPLLGHATQNCSRGSRARSISPTAWWTGSHLKSPRRNASA